MLLLLRLLHQLVRDLVLHLVLLVVKLYLQQMMLKLGMQEEKKLFLFVLKHHRKISQV